MSQLIKSLKQDNKIFFPQTSAEAVLIKDNNQVYTLDKYLKRPIITPNTTTEVVKIQYNEQGKIIKVEPVDTQNIYVGGQKYLEYNGNQEVSVQFGEDFKILNNNIVLTWNNI